jgi:hypothetical protein
LRAWFSGPKNSFVRQIAQQKRAASGALDREVVRRMLLDLAWKAYTYTADALHTLMWVFQQLIPESLAGPERSRFERRFLKQPCLGQLPFFLLFERFPFLKGVWWTIEEGPDDREAVATLHRLLAYYGEMASARREKDRTVQARRAHGYKGECSLDPEFDPESRGEAAESQLFIELADRVRSEWGVRCGCPEPNWEDRVVEWNEERAVFSRSARPSGKRRALSARKVDHRRARKARQFRSSWWKRA